MKFPSGTQIKTKIAEAKKALASFAALLVAVTATGLVPSAAQPYVAGALVILGVLGVYVAPANKLTLAQRRKVVIAHNLAKAAEPVPDAPPAGTPARASTTLDLGPLGGRVAGPVQGGGGGVGTFNAGRVVVAPPAVPETVTKPAQAAAKKLAAKKAPAKKVAPVKGAAKKPAPRKRT